MILSEQPHHEHPPAHRYTLSYIRWRKDLLVESNWGGIVELGLFDWLIHSFIPVPLTQFPLPQTEAQPATDTNSTATACLSGASGDPYIWWYLLYFAHRLERQLELQRRSIRVLEINWSTQPPLVFPAEWSEVLTMTAPHTTCSTVPFNGGCLCWLWRSGLFL